MRAARDLFNLAASRPREALEDALGLAALSALIVIGVSATGFF